MVEYVICELCKRQVFNATKHHLLPLQNGGKNTQTVNLCQPCHTTLHVTFTNAELATIYNSIEKLQKSERLEKFLKWIENKQIERIPVKRKNVDLHRKRLEVLLI